MDNVDKKENNNLDIFKNVAVGIFDIKNTLKKLNNSEYSYIKLLKYFAKNYKNILNEFNIFIQNRDINSLKAKVHELKGVSGNIGAIKLYERMVILDRFVKKDEYLSPSLLQDFEKDLNEVLSCIDKIEIKEIAKEKFDKEKVIDILVKIKENLEVDISLCSELLYEVTPYLQESYKNFSNELTSFLDEFDTDNVTDLIEKFLKGLK